MSESTRKPKPKDDGIHSMEDAMAKAQETYEQAPPEVKEAVEKSKSFYEEHRREVHAALIGLVVLRVYKKKVAKTTAKAVVKALAKQGNASFVEAQNFPTLFEIWNDLKGNPDMAYIPHGGGMVHLLGPSKDIIVTVFGNFENMNTEQIFAYAGRALGMRGY